MKFFIEVFITLIVIIDPIGVLPVFVGLTQKYTNLQRKQTAFRAFIISSSVFILFGFAGDWLLDILGITVPAFRIAGGILLLLSSIEMVFAKHSGLTSTTAEEEKEALKKEDISIFPLSFPLIAGPGALTTLLVLMRDVEGKIGMQIGVICVSLLVLLLTYLCLRLAIPLTKVLGVTGTNVLMRVFGIILAALAVQFIVQGIQESFSGEIQKFLSFQPMPH